MLCADQVIAALKARLVAAATPAGANVFSERDYALPETTQFAWIVHPLDETLDVLTVHWPQLREHRLVVGLKGCVNVTGESSAALSAMRLAAEQALFDTEAHATLDALGVPIVLKRVVSEPGERLDTRKAELLMQIEAAFKTLANAPETFA